MTEDTHISISKVVLVSMLLAFVLFTAWLAVGDRYLIGACHKELTVEEIVKVHHRTAYARLSDGNVYDYGQPDNLAPGATKCVHWSNTLEPGTLAIFKPLESEYNREPK